MFDSNFADFIGIMFVIMGVLLVIAQVLILWGKHDEKSGNSDQEDLK